VRRVCSNIIILVLLVSCGRNAPPIQPPLDRTLEFVATCSALFLEELEREIDQSGLTECVRLARTGQTADDLRAWLRGSDEWGALQDKKRLPPPLPPLEVRGREFFVDDQKFHWQYVTAFQLLDHVADGRLADAEQFLVWAKNEGFNGVRVLATAQGLFQLSPDEGRLALGQFFELLRRYQMRVELVAVADSANWSEAQIHQQVAGVAFACAVQTACTLQFANEFYHPTQHERIHDIGFLTALAGHVPPGAPYTLAPPHNDESDEPRGLYATRHLDRSRDPFNMVRRVRELEALSAKHHIPVVNDEAIGFGEVHEPGRRLTNPSIAYAFGVLSRIFDVGTTFHCQDCLYARVPGPVQQDAARAFIQGIRDIPTGDRLNFRNAGWADSPVEGADFNNVIRAYSGVIGNTSYTVLLGVYGSPNVRWRGGWLARRTIRALPEVQLLEVTQ
jgi:hypothetical protein